MDLLKYFSRERPQWGVRELAKEMHISHTIAYRMMATFERNGFLRQDQETRKYELGIKFMEYGAILRDRLNLTQLIIRL